MKPPKEGASHFFVDESGDPIFYDAKGNLIVGQPGCSPVFILGFISTPDPYPLRRAVQDLQQEVCGEPYFKSIPSLAKTANAFHANSDAPEIRYLFYRLIRELDFKAQFIVARKIEKVFRNAFRAEENRFYDHLVMRVFRNILHRSKHNYITYAVRGSRARQRPLAEAIARAKQSFETRHGKFDTSITVEPQSPKGEPCLSIIDYVNWALYRAYTKGEMRYFDYIGDKVRFIQDIYDWQVFPKNIYFHRAPPGARKGRGKGRSGRTTGNPFHISKTTPL